MLASSICSYYIAGMKGLLLVEGEDIEPKHFNATRETYSRLEKTHPLKDEIEINLTRHALRRNLPILGMCERAWKKRCNQKASKVEKRISWLLLFPIARECSRILPQSRSVLVALVAHASACGFWFLQGLTKAEEPAEKV